MSEPNNPGRPEGLPITDSLVDHLRDQAVHASDGVWVNPDVLEHLLAVFDAASRWNNSANNIEHARACGDLTDAVERAVGEQ